MNIKTKIKKLAVCMMIIAAVCLCGCQNNDIQSSQSTEVTGSFNFTVLKAGQADTIFMQTQNHNVIIDCGEKDDGDKMVSLLREKNVSDIDYVFITHFDKDHVGGFPYVADAVSTNNIIVPDYEGSGSEYKKYLKTIQNKNLSVTKLTEDITFTLDDVLFEVSPPQKKSYTEGDNDFSLAVSVTHGDNTFLFTGDAEKDRLAELIIKFGRQYDFLKVPHHGRYNKNTERFVEVVKPAYSVICDSEKNPAEDKTLSVLESVGSHIYCTKDGDISVSSDGREIKIFQ